MKILAKVLVGCFCVAVVLATSCMRQPKYVIDDPEELALLDKAWKQRKDFPDLDKLDYYTPMYSRYLKGMKICLDPGHGGDADRPRYKRGPTDAREAIMNWKVANYLKDFLEESGAEVKLTRDGDVDVSLRDRVNVANEWGADLFLAIHHNAATPMANRTTTWFHLQPDFQPANLDVARYIQQGVADALRLPQIDSVPLKSDQLMYESGFGVLRGLNMVGCLCEASFFSNPYEEVRLQKDSYLKREAYGYFLGLSRYAWMGIPKAVLVEPPADGVTTLTLPKIQMFAETGFRGRPNWGNDKPWIFTDSVKVTLDGEAVPATFDKETGMINVEVAAPLELGDHSLIGVFRNYNGNFAHPIAQKFTVIALEE